MATTLPDAAIAAPEGHDESDTRRRRRLRTAVLTALIAAAGGTPWLACAYLVATAIISVVATSLIREQDLHL
jgi:hypothetical protein